MTLTKLAFREATSEDLPVIVKLLASDPLGAKREYVSEPLREGYLTAFNVIDADPNNEPNMPRLTFKSWMSFVSLAAPDHAVKERTYQNLSSYQLS